MVEEQQVVTWLMVERPKECYHRIREPFHRECFYVTGTLFPPLFSNSQSYRRESEAETAGWSLIHFPSIPKGIQEPVWLTRQTQRLARLSTRLNRGTRRLLGLTVLR